MFSHFCQNKFKLKCLFCAQPKGSRKIDIKADFGTFRMGNPPLVGEQETCRSVEPFLLNLVCALHWVPDIAMFAACWAMGHCAY